MARATRSSLSGASTAAAAASGGRAACGSPPALAALCDEYAGERACGDGNDGLRAYVSVGVCGAEAEMPMKVWLEGRLRRQYA